MTDRATTATAAFDGAIEKLVVLLETKFGRMDDRHARDTIRGD